MTWHNLMCAFGKHDFNPNSLTIHYISNDIVIGLYKCTYCRELKSYAFYKKDIGLE